MKSHQHSGECTPAGDGKFVFLQVASTDILRLVHKSETCVGDDGMKFSARIVLGIGLLVAASWTGYQWFRGAETGSEEPVAQADSAETDSGTDETVPKAPARHLVLRLKTGDRFPLEKIVEQTVTQQINGTTKTSRSRLRMLMTITVDAVRESKRLLQVRYQQVQFAQDIDGRQIAYDSRVADRPAPLELAAYQGLVHNGFSFWLGPDNHIVDLVGFRAFLERCVARVPLNERRSVMTDFMQSNGDDRIANFIDDSIGVLPYNPQLTDKGTLVAEGDHWSRRRQQLRPIPLYLDDTYTLKDLKPRYAVIEISGRITPSDTFGPSQQPGKNLRVRVRGGRSFGQCTIDCGTGLPIRSRVERTIEMIVRLSNGIEFPQRKKVVTTINAYPQQSPGDRPPLRISDAARNTTH